MGTFSLLIIGLLLSGILSYAKMTNRTGICIGSTAACDRVQNSPQAYVLGIPIAYLGNHAYMALLCLWLLKMCRGGRARAVATRTIFVIALLGALYSVYLTYIQVFVLRGICALCASSAVIMVLLAALSGLEMRADAEADDRANTLDRSAISNFGGFGAMKPGMLLTLMVVLMVFTLIVFAAGLWAGISVSELDGLRAEVAALRDADGHGLDRRAHRRYGAIPGKKYDVSVGDAPTLGPDSAPVTIVEFTDFDCGYCPLVVPTLRKVREGFPDDVRIVFKHYPRPLSPKSWAAHKAAVAAMEQGKFWAMHDLIFEQKGVVDENKLIDLAGRLALDLEGFKEAMGSERVRAKIAADQAQGGQLEIPGTPVFFINGEFISGGRSYEFFESKIRAILDEAGDGAATKPPTDPGDGKDGGSP